MERDLGRIVVKKAIVHEVPQRLAGDADAAPILSETDSKLSKEIRNYFAERIQDSLLSASLAVVFDPEATSPVPDIARRLIGKRPRGFVKHSQSIAQHLHATQSGVNTGGLLTVILATIEGDPALAILKLEKEEGLRAQHTRQGGKRTFNMEHIKELMLSNKTRVFKVGLFAEEASAGGIEGMVSDKQRGYQAGKDVADFFLRRFLGCALRDKPDLATRSFFEASQEFFNDRVSDARKRAQYEIALLAEMNSNDSQVSPRRFANGHLPTSLRQPYLSHLEDEGCPRRRFEKDTGLIKSHLQRLDIRFKSGIQVLARPEVFGKELELRQIGKKAHVRIEDDLEDMRGRGRR